MTREIIFGWSKNTLLKQLWMRVNKKQFHNILAWEPGTAQANHTCSSRLPALGRKSRIQQFFPLKVDTLNVESGNKAQDIPVIIYSDYLQNLGQIGHWVPDL